MSNLQVTKFYKSVREVFVDDTEYLLKWCSFSDELVKHEAWIDFNERLNNSLASVEFFFGGIL